MIAIEDLHIDLGEFALRGIDLEVEDGDYMMILGPTGAGKTVLLETIAGIYEPDRGKIYLDGEDITRISPRNRFLGMVYQDYMLFPHLTVEDNILFGLKARKVKKDKAVGRAMKLANMLSVSHLLHRRPDTLSGGEQQRVAIARALAVEPKVLLLDEPLSALDPETRASLRDELRRIREMTDTIMVHVTHSLDEAFLLGNRMAIMDAGRIVQIGDVGEVFKKPNSRFVADFVGITNIYRGISSRENGLFSIAVNGNRLLSVAPVDGDVYTTIRPESIMLSLDPVRSSARNTLKGRIARILDEGRVVKVVVDVGIQMIAAITRYSFEDMELGVGKEVYLAFKATDVHVFSA